MADDTSPLTFETSATTEKSGDAGTKEAGKRSPGSHSRRNRTGPPPRPPLAADPRPRPRRHPVSPLHVCMGNPHWALAHMKGKTHTLPLKALYSARAVSIPGKGKRPRSSAPPLWSAISHIPLLRPGSSSTTTTSVTDSVLQPRAAAHQQLQHLVWPLASPQYPAS